MFEVKIRSNTEILFQDIDNLLILELKDIIIGINGSWIHGKMSEIVYI